MVITFVNEYSSLPDLDDEIPEKDQQWFEEQPGCRALMYVSKISPPPLHESQQILKQLLDWIALCPSCPKNFNFDRPQLKQELPPLTTSPKRFINEEEKSYEKRIENLGKAMHDLWIRIVYPPATFKGSAFLNPIYKAFEALEKLPKQSNFPALFGAIVCGIGAVGVWCY
jgi:hypothetical protein